MALVTVATAANEQKVADEWSQMRRAPTTIMAVTEATQPLFRYLRREGPELHNPVHAMIAERPEKTWSCIAGAEEEGTLLLALDD